MDKTNWTVEENVTGKFTASEAEKYWESLRIHFISYLVFPGVFCLQAIFPIKIGQVPPILHPILAGNELYNTEHVKNSYVLKNVHEIQGSQNKLVELIVAGELDVTTLDKMSNIDLRLICKRLDFASLTRYKYFTSSGHLVRVGSHQY